MDGGEGILSNSEMDLDVDVRAIEPCYATNKAGKPCAVAVPQGVAPISECLQCQLRHNLMTQSIPDAQMVTFGC